MVGPKSTQTRVVGIIIDEMHPYILFKFQVIGFYEKRVGMHLVCYYPHYLVCVLFGPTIPTSSIYLVAYYTCFF